MPRLPSSWFKDFTATSEELHISICSMVTAINEVNLSSNEGSQGTQRIPKKAADMMNYMAKVLQLMDETRASSARLVHSVERFRV